MKITFLFFLSFLSVYSLLAQKTINDPNAEKRPVGSFHGINVATGIKVMLTEGSTEAVAVSASAVEYRDKIVTKVEDGILKIYYENKLGAINTRKEKKELKAYVSYKSLDELAANTGAIVEVDGVLKSPSLKMKVNTGGIVNGEVEVDNLDVSQNTGAVVSLSGEAGKLSYDADLGALFKGSDLKTNNCNVSVSTGAGIYITVQKELYAKANTGGFVKYSGAAGNKEIKTNTGGSVTKM